MQDNPDSCNQETIIHTFPWAIEATRFTIARLEHARDLRSPDRIKREVLKVFEHMGDSKISTPLRRE